MTAERCADSGHASALVSLLALTILILILGHALVVKDFRFAYVAQYSSRLLPWYYSLSALWVGQSGSLLVWSWLLGVVAVVYRFWPYRRANSTSDITFAILLTYLAFLAAMMVFGADPMQSSFLTPQEGAGLSPQLQHPAMLMHPPLVFLGYAIWAVPFALALSGLVTGRIDRDWVRQSRSWSLSAWAVLGLGILLGAQWAYEELGWGGYWGWDPVENSSLLPWLTGTALIHCGLAWQYRGIIKKGHAFVGRGHLHVLQFCRVSNAEREFFGSLHEFSQSPIGWLFLLLMAVPTCVAAVIIPMRRKLLSADSRISSIWTREAFALISIAALLCLTVIVFLGTLAVPLSGIILPRRFVLGTEFYNHALIPLGLIIIAATAIAPALRWGSVPKAGERKMLFIAIALSTAMAILAVLLGLRGPLLVAVAWTAALAAVVFAGRIFLDYKTENASKTRIRAFKILGTHRRRYAGFVIHLGFICIAVGVSASSLATQRLEATMQRGESVDWAGRSIRFVEIHERHLPDRVEVAARLEVTDGSQRSVTLLPAQHLYLLQNQWAAKVAIDSSWSGDFYVILHSGMGEERINVTFVDNPLMCWIWIGGSIIGLGALAALWPARVAQGTRACNPVVGKLPCTSLRRLNRPGLADLCGKAIPYTMPQAVNYGEL